MRFENVALLSITLSILLASCSTSTKLRAVVAFPQDWPERDYRNCYLNGSGHTAGFDPGSDRRELPQLDCDRFVKGEIIHHTPASQMFVVDVSLSGHYT